MKAAAPVALPRCFAEIMRYCLKTHNKNGFGHSEAVRLSRNYSFADKQERTVGRSKVVQKFPYGNFFPLKV